MRMTYDVAEVRGFWTINTDQPWRQPQHVMCEVRIGTKQINLVALEKAFRQGRFSAALLFIYGSSAFGTLDMANSRRHYLMRTIIADEYNKRMRSDVVDTCLVRIALDKRKAER